MIGAQQAFDYEIFGHRTQSIYYICIILDWMMGVLQTVLTMSCGLFHHVHTHQLITVDTEVPTGLSNRPQCQKTVCLQLHFPGGYSHLFEYCKTG